MSNSYLKMLLQDIAAFSDLPDLEIKGLALDSRVVLPGNLFFACKGTQVDGRQFIDTAIEKGACVVLAEADDTQFSLTYRQGTPVIAIPELSQKVGVIASRFYAHPSQQMRVIGITGTNGKTSSSHLIASALHTLNFKCGVIGTLGNGLYGHIQETNLTTPDAVTLQKTLADFVRQNAQYTVMEVSSHSLDQGRVNGIDFAAGVYTNLTRDHLDYHGTMENYGNAKKKLFESIATQCAIINADDEFGMQLITELHNQKIIYAYGTMPHKLPSNVSFIYAENIRLDLSGIKANIHSPWGEGELRANLIGKFNVSNLLAVLSTLCVLNIPFNDVLYAISKLQPVSGRMQMLGGGDKPLAVIDYSHTPDALEKALIALRYHCQGKLYCVFGCGGDRDRGKRPIMAKIAEAFSDVVILTDDNPRTENAEQIFEDIKTGFLHPEKIMMQHDRAKAIHTAVNTAQAGDCILIAGKGAETYQIIGKEKYPFNDSQYVVHYMNL